MQYDTNKEFLHFNKEEIGENEQIELLRDTILITLLEKKKNDLWNKLWDTQLGREIDTIETKIDYLKKKINKNIDLLNIVTECTDDTK